MSEFDNLHGHASWQAKLKELLSAAEKAARAGDADAREKMANRLISFIELSFPNDAAIQAMDEIAGKTMVALMEQNIEQALASIAERNVELAGLARQFKSAAVQAQQTAAKLRLERLHDTLAVVNGSIDAFKKLEDSLGTDDASLQQAVADALKAGRRLRDAIGAVT